MTNFPLALGVLKCKKDKDYPGGELCPMCSFPRHLQGKEVLALEGMVCSGPVITSPLRATKPENPDSEVMTPDKFLEPLGNITLGLSDEHGNKVDLECGVGKPRELSRVNWQQVSQHRLAANVTWSVDLDCPIDRDNYERLWRLIAYYSDVPAHLRREMMLSKEPHRSYRYRQDMERDAQYYTGVKVIVMAQPRWLMQASLGLRLNRPQSTGKRVKLVLSSQLSQSVEAEQERRRGRTWVMIESTNTTQPAMAVVVGGTSQMQCNIRSSGEVVLHWVMPDGSRLEVPYSSPNGRVSASSDGQLVIKSIDHSDMGVYYCVAKVHGDQDILPFRLAVEESSSPPPGDDRPQPLPIQGYTGESIALPCEASGSPNAEINWILPGSNIVSTRANTSRALVYSNGTLRVLQGQLSDSGYYKCVAINQHGVDTLATKVNVTKRVTQTAIGTPRKFTKTPQSASGVRTNIKVPTEESVDGSGDEHVMKDVNTKTKVDLSRRRGSISGRRVVHPSRNVWRRPVPRKPVQPRVDARKPAADARRRVNVASNKIDPQKWADILAKVRDRKVQNSVTPNTVRQTTERKRTGATTDQTTLLEDNIEGSGEGGAMQEEKGAVHITTTPAPMRIISTTNYILSTPSMSASKHTTHVTSDTRTNTIDATPNPRKTHNMQAARNTQLTQSTRVTSNKPVTHRSHTTADVRHATHNTQGMRSPQITQDINHTTPNTALPNSDPRAAASTSIPPLPQPTSAPQSSLTRWQTNTNRASSRGSMPFDDSSQGNQDTNTDVPVVTTHNTSNSQREGKRKVLVQSGDFISEKDRQLSIDVSQLSPPVAPTQPLSVKYLSQASTAPPEEPTVDILPAQTQLAAASPTDRPQSPTFTGAKGRELEGPPRHRRPNSKRKNGVRRKSKENRRRQKLKGGPQLIATTLTPVDARLARTSITASIPLKIEKAQASFPTAVPFTDSQVTSSGTVSHKESTVSRLDDNRPSTRPSSSPATMDGVLSWPKPLPNATTVFPTTPFSTTLHSTTPLSTTPLSTSAPPSLPTTISLLAAQSDGEMSHENVPFPLEHSDRPTILTALQTFPSSTLPPSTPSVEKQRVSVSGVSVSGDPGPDLRFDKSPGSAHTPPQVQPDVRQQNQSGRRYTHSQVAENELFGKILRPAPLQPPPSSPAPTVQHETSTSSGEHEPSSTDGQPGDKLYNVVWEKQLTTTKGPFANGSAGPSSDPTKTDVVDEHLKQTIHTRGKVVVSTPSMVASTPSPSSTTSSHPPISRLVLSSVVPTVVFSTATDTPLTTLHQPGPGFNHIPDGHASDKVQGQGRELPPLSPHGQARNFSTSGAKETLAASQLETHSQNKKAVDLHTDPKPTSPAPRPSGAHPVKRTTTLAPAFTRTAVAASTVGVQTSSERRPTIPLPPSQDVSRGHPLPAPLSPPRGNPWIMRTYTQTLTVDAETDAHLPCEAVGQPHPFLSWTKVSTGMSVYLLGSHMADDTLMATDM
ncbi:Matrix-remodeling-associated protein 5 [Merluccius polli]|uniref:Matrix-remodeling-associated protein 5 n=1 Tax=Merluccius polli TaxID=89951 RepID=A0AA47N8E9_MERPO|nr:Matrix-remodeling-associated protein 5 [Merluccius polli]